MALEPASVDIDIDGNGADAVVSVSLSHDDPRGYGSAAAAARAVIEEDEIAEIGLSDKALLMGAGPGGFVDGPIINWHSHARSFEAGVLLLVALLLMFGLGGGDWLHGANGDLSTIHAGLKTASVGNATGRLGEACHPSDPGDAVTCAVASAGGWCAGFLGLALFSCACLIVRLILELLYTRGMLAVALARLNEKVPLQTLAPLRTAGPAAGWAILVLSLYLGLFLYAAKSPGSLGAGPAALGASYGLVRLALVGAGLGAVAHYAAARAIDDALLLETLDAIKAAVVGLEQKPRVLQ
eukprot:scaffold1525_cov128-Isochrysis_galbana.AAC.1